MGMNIGEIKIVRLSSAEDNMAFDCGDADLNDFLLHDAIDYQLGLVAVTYLIKSEDETIGYVSLANDKISINDSGKAVWRKIKQHFNRSKHRGDYPAVKVGRLAVSKKHQGHDIGSKILDFIKYSFVQNNRTGCAFVTVDALRSALPFYLKNDFRFLDDSQIEKDSRTIQLYYNLTDLV